MRPFAVIAIALATGMSGACSSVLDGPAERPGYRGHAYIPTDAEKADCPTIAFNMGRSIDAINAMPSQAKTQRDGPPSSVVHAVQRVSGNGIPVLEDYKRERARLKALADIGAAKGCPAVDFEKRIKEASDKLAAFRKDVRGK